MDVCLVIWLVTLHGVNTAMYFAVTRVAHGWTKTLMGLGIFYSYVAVAMSIVRCANVGPEVFAPYSYLFTFGCWLALTVILSRRGSRSAAFFVAVLCGAHQLVLGVVSYVLMNHFRSWIPAKLAGSALMLLLGAIMITFVLPRVRCLSRSVDWRFLNVVVSILLVLVYTTGFFPIWAAGGSLREAIPFIVAVLTLVSSLCGKLSQK